ncbi:MAG: 3'-5' exonuclease [Pirellula sp.]
MQSIAVLDFETANHQANSACQLGIAILEPWQIVRQKKWMIRPGRLYFSPRCVAVHGITASDVLDAPTWEEIWSEVLEWIDGNVLVAHNAGFDANVLLATSLHYELAVPPLDVQCTRLISKRSWPALRSHSLASMAEHLSIEFQHHDALEDAKVSARLLIEAATKAGAVDLEDLEDRLGLVRGRVWSDRVRQPRSVRRSRIETVAESPGRYEPKRYRNDGAPLESDSLRRGRRIADEILMHCKGSSPIDGKHLVLLGTLLGLDRQDSSAFLSQLGANVQSDINLQTQYVIQGNLSQSESDGEDSESYAGLAQTLAGITSRRQRDIDTRREEGHALTILSQRQLLAMLPSGIATARGDER